MGPTYLVLLSFGVHCNDAALVLYSGTDEAEARKTYDKAHAGRIGRFPDARVYLTTVRAEARLS